jgi:hypothetical protein
MGASAIQLKNKLRLPFVLDNLVLMNLFADPAAVAATAAAAAQPVQQRLAS